MTQHEIALGLKHDIAELVEIALVNAKEQPERDKIFVLRNCIIAGLGDYEIAWRDALQFGLKRGMQLAREEEE